MMGVVAVSVTLIIFLGALIGGLQRRLIASVTGAIPHVVVRQPERVPLSVADAAAAPDGPLYAGERIRLERRKRKIEDWPFWLAWLQRFDPDVAAVSPVVEKPGVHVAGRPPAGGGGGGRDPGAPQRRGGHPVEAGDGTVLRAQRRRGRPRLQAADEFSLRLEDKIRLVSIEGNAGTYVAGISTAASPPSTAAPFI